MMDEPRDLNAMAGLDGSPVGVYVSGQFFKMGQLSQADYVDCAAWKAAQAIEVVIAAAPQNFRPDVSEIKASAIQRIMCEPADPLKMLSDVRCIERLAFLAVQRGGEWPPTGNWLGFTMKLDKRGYQELQQAVWKCSGFAVEAKASDAEAANATANP
jgi:hypothetical protein